MADNITIPASGTGTATPVVATEDISGVHYQKVIVGASKRIAQTPTISAASAYAPGDAVGGKLTFAGAARFDSGGGLIVGVTVIDKDQERAPLELVLFDQDFTATADNAAFDPSDADLANAVAVIPINQWHNFNDNSIGYSGSLAIPFQCGNSLDDLYGQLVTRGAPTYSATSDLIVILWIVQE